MSTVQVWITGVASRLPAGSTALTSKACGPSRRPVSDFGDLQPTDVHSPPSCLHSNVEPACGEENSSVIEVDLVTAGNPPGVVVSGGEAVGAVALGVARKGR